MLPAKLALEVASFLGEGLSVEAEACEEEDQLGDGGGFEDGVVAAGFEGPGVSAAGRDVDGFALNGVGVELGRVVVSLGGPAFPLAVGSGDGR